MCFCKKNIHISNVINTFLSLPLSVERRSRSGGWRRMYAQCASEISFLTLAKENQSPLGLYRNPDIFLYKSSFCASNSWPGFCFVLSPHSSLITQSRRHPPERLPLLTVRWSERCVYYVWNMDIFLTKMHGFAFIHPPKLCEASFMDTRALFDVLWTVEQKHPLQW